MKVSLSNFDIFLTNVPLYSMTKFSSQKINTRNYNYYLLPFSDRYIKLIIKSPYCNGQNNLLYTVNTLLACSMPDLSIALF